MQRGEGVCNADGVEGGVKNHPKSADVVYGRPLYFPILTWEFDYYASSTLQIFATRV